MINLQKKPVQILKYYCRKKIITEVIKKVFFSDIVTFADFSVQVSLKNKLGVNKYQYMDIPGTYLESGSHYFLDA